MLRQLATGTAMADDYGWLAFERVKTTGKAEIRGCIGSIQQAALGIEMKNIWSKFFANPEIAVGGDHHRLHIKVCAGKPTLGRALANNIERNLVIGIRELNKTI